MQHVVHSKRPSREMILKESSSIEAFMQARPLHRGARDLIGMETELYIVNESGAFVPAAAEVLPEISSRLSEIEDGPEASPEFTACQIELKSPPETSLYACIDKLILAHEIASSVLADRGLQLVECELAPEGTVPYVCYPDPRYEAIMEEFTRARVEAMFRVASCQFSFSARTWDERIATRNALVNAREKLFTRDGWVNPGRRQLLEDIVFPSSKDVVIYGNVRDAYDHACSKGDRVVINPSFDWDHEAMKPYRDEERIIGAISPTNPDKMLAVGEFLLGKIGR